jgi:hypothetical protein
MSSGNLLHKFHIWVEKHNVEMLDSVYALQAPPILEPHHAPAVHLTAECIVNIVLDLPPSTIRQVARFLVFFQLEFGPYYQMYDSRVQPIGPVVEEDLEIRWVCKGMAAWLKRGPLEEVVLDVFDYGAVDPVKAVYVLSIAAEVGGNALEDIYAV